MSESGMKWRKGKIHNDKALLQRKISNAKAKAKRELAKNPNAPIMKIPSLREAMESIKSRQDYNDLIHDLAVFTWRRSMKIVEDKATGIKAPLYEQHLSDREITIDNGLKMKQREYNKLLAMFEKNEKRKEKRRKEIEARLKDKYKVGALSEADVRGTLNKELDEVKKSDFKKMMKNFKQRQDIEHKFSALEKQLGKGYQQYRDNIYFANYKKAVYNTFSDSQASAIIGLVERLDAEQQKVFFFSYVGDVYYVYKGEDINNKYSQIMNHLYFILDEDTTIDENDENLYDYGEFEDYE